VTLSGNVPPREQPAIAATHKIDAATVVLAFIALLLGAVCSVDGINDVGGLEPPNEREQHRSPRA
jgi:hypothetical protein